MSSDQIYLISMGTIMIAIAIAFYLLTKTTRKKLIEQNNKPEGKMKELIFFDIHIFWGAVISFIGVGVLMYAAAILQYFDFF